MRSNNEISINTSIPGRVHINKPLATTAIKYLQATTTIKW